MTLTIEVLNGAMKRAVPTPRSAAIDQQDDTDDGVYHLLRTGGQNQFRRRRAGQGCPLAKPAHEH